jgi:hypothetical protein
VQYQGEHSLETQEFKLERLRLAAYQYSTWDCSGASRLNTTTYSERSERKNWWVE